MKVAAIISVVLLLVSIGKVTGWGQEGHMAIAQLAANRLTPTASSVYTLLTPLCLVSKY